MGMTVGIKSSGDRHLDLHFSSSNYDGNGKWGTLHIAICSMQSEGGQDMPLQSLQCELDHADIDRLIRELQSAKALLAGEDANQYVHPGLVSMSDWEAKRMRELFEPPPQPEPDELCCQCGFRFDQHAWTGACIEKLAMAFRFSKTERFRA